MKVNMGPYKYSKLREHTEIRLFTLAPGDLNHDIHLSLFHAPLLSTSTKPTPIQEVIESRSRKDTTSRMESLGVARGPISF